MRKVRLPMVGESGILWDFAIAYFTCAVAWRNVQRIGWSGAGVIVNVWDWQRMGSTQRKRNTAKVGGMANGSAQSGVLVADWAQAAVTLRIVQNIAEPAIGDCIGRKSQQIPILVNCANINCTFVT